ncbi:bifunctional tRNA (5-methylaminomethyl-2-thiouridine)(34)-methyltransferase MnmD/FAD-dependent 5-carboxymethylaminomethyl-2-thiouridine(34) oxidoreductase MnmC [Uliginosibacterium sp. H1]|uniref:bifunctional tRNA (5-methylaminomethyl-2-thiouridine)(34)-methyltransferase MnmD/FAD-dependent 5-carboxymethylaminomethyl-2-thiouridine(34) oxidoreductase MnmC n=1 Tax=Uliginosibacterium sp. H1 TaxID=3114757 RepID=UPI002E198A50|nr:bifunctional tRNA (5-methylaminomethyl-2-thiouridine)(34)-methyltransferase MnmD/FAD-dependent 5-carboxymethylaminomethyl-2-thiouridine(34) oxidoreductase MnmC [Uliginosibacterium sp. H1]
MPHRPTPLIPARLEQRDSTPYSATYGDVFHTRAGALAQAEHVFLRGNDLPVRWQGQQRFCIVETGFGLGHNFLATWAAWRDDPRRCERLHFVSAEKHPFPADDLAQAHHDAGVPKALSDALCERWPLLVPGFHRIELEGGRVVLSLLFGDAAETLPELVAQADAIYLDGFAPDRNPDMWSPPVFAALAAAARPGCTLATWSVSAAVRHGLAEAGFTTEKRPGFGGKRDMLTGQRDGVAPAADAAVRHALIIGAGLAGCGLAERLALRGWQVDLVDAADAPAQGASGNIAGAFRPVPSVEDKPLSRLTRAGFSFALGHFARLADAGHPIRRASCGALHLARDERQASKQREAIAALGLPPEFVRWVSADEAATLCGQPCAYGGWWFPQGGWVQPGSLCTASLAATGARLSSHYGRNVARIRHADGLWQALDDEGRIIASAPVLILANAHDARRLGGFARLPLRAARGQVSHLAATAVASLQSVVCGQGYVTPAVDGLIPTGASFLVDDLAMELREAEHAENLDKLQRMLPGYAHGISPSGLAGRVGLRPVTLDKLPVAGEAGRPGLHLLNGYGARGLVWGSLCAELLASQLHGEPLPLERDLVAMLSPLRFDLANSAPA